MATDLNLPEAVLFDFGDTLLGGGRVNTIEGNARVLELCENPNAITPFQLQEIARGLDDQLPSRADAIVEFRVD